MSDENQTPQSQQKEPEIVWANCTRHGCDGQQAEKLPNRQIASAATAVRFKCLKCGNTWSTPLGSPIVTDI